MNIYMYIYIYVYVYIYATRTAGQRTAAKQYVRDIGVCTICNAHLHSRNRLITDLADTRVRSKLRGTGCNLRVSEISASTSRCCAFAPTR